MNLKVIMNKAYMLNIRRGAGVNHKIMTTISKSDKQYTATNSSVVRSSGKNYTWYYLKELGGWGNGHYFTTVSGTNSTQKPKPTPGPVANAPAVPTTPGASSGPNVGMNKELPSHVTGKGKGLDEKLASLLEEAMESRADFDASTKLFGQPFQFTTSTDTRITGGAYPLGRKFTETIVAEAPIVYIQPGKANFLPDMKEEDRNAFKKLMEEKSKDLEKWALEDILHAESRYFDFTSDYRTYMYYVNMLCRISASFMNLPEYRFYDWTYYKYKNSMVPTKEDLEESEVREVVFDDNGKEMKPGPNKDGILSSAAYLAKSTFTKIKDDFSSIKEKSVDAIMGGNYQFVQFYVDPNTSFQESSSNSTAPSMVSSILDQASSISKEVAFLLDSAGDNGIASSFASGIIDGAGSLTQMIGNSFGDSVVARFFQSAETILDGSNIAFPDIWGNSDYSKSYNISINLISPYGSKLAVYMHILVPLYHLMVFALPRQTSANGFGHPFLVKVSSKGWFNCEMGMVDGIQVEKVQGSYTVDGLPTEVRVNLSVRDLYSTLSMAPTTKPGLFFSNSSLMNWLAVTSGLDITMPAFKEKWQAVGVVLTGRVLDIPSNIANSVLDTINKTIRQFTTFR